MKLNVRVYRYNYIKTRHAVHLFSFQTLKCCNSWMWSLWQSRYCLEAWHIYYLACTENCANPWGGPVWDFAKPVDIIIIPSTHWALSNHWLLWLYVNTMLIKKGSMPPILVTNYKIQQNQIFWKIKLKDLRRAVGNKIWGVKCSEHSGLKMCSRWHA